jgi:hypothetical protein
VNDLDVYRLLQKRDEERSQMIIQLVEMCVSGLVEANELERFTERTRATIESLTKGH